MDSRDGQTGWEYERNQMDGKDEEGTNKCFFFLFFLLLYFSLYFAI
jgi:hypothetical protein